MQRCISINDLNAFELFTYDQHAIARVVGIALTPKEMTDLWLALPEPVTEGPRGNPRNPYYDDERSKMAGIANNHHPKCAFPATHCHCEMLYSIAAQRR